jgi:hypothetical protein
MLDSSPVNFENVSIQEKKDFSNAKLSAGTNLIHELSNDIVLGDIEKDNTDNVEGLTKFYEGLSAIDLYSEDAANQIEELANEYGV